MQHAPITTPITDKLASMPWIRWFRQLVDRVEEIKDTADAPAWGSITEKPAEFPPESHTHPQYLTEETDPTVPVHVKAISQDDIDRWGDAVTDEELQEVVDALNALAARETTITGDATGAGAASIPVTVTGIRGQTVPTPVAGFLRWTGSAWAFVEGPLPESMALGDLSDVATSVPAAGDVLKFAGGEWVNAPSVIRHRQLSPSATWGPIPHPFGRPVNVETIGPLGEEFDCSIVHSPSFDSVTINLGMALAGEAIIS